MNVVAAKTITEKARMWLTNHGAQFERVRGLWLVFLPEDFQFWRSQTRGYSHHITYHYGLPGVFIEGGEVMTSGKFIRQRRRKPSFPHKEKKRMKIDHTIRRGESEYPALLDLWEQGPEVLYCAGNIDLLHLPSIAVIGTREPTNSAKKTAYNLARAFAEKHVTIISGLALGCDTYAHLGALAAHGTTIAILGTPLNTIYPSENHGLAERIVAENGLVLSAYKKRAQNRQEGRQRFVQRDYLQAALSLAVVPVQASEEDGTKYAVGWARAHDRIVAVPRPPADDYKEHPAFYGLLDQLLGDQSRGDILVLGSKQDYPSLITQLGTQVSSLL